MSVLLAIFTFVLILVSLFLILVVLMQKAKSDGGMGSAMGGGMAEATFGADTGNVLSKATINAAIIFFVLGFALYLGSIYHYKHGSKSGGALPTIAVPLPAVPMPASAPAAAAPVAPLTPAPAPATGGTKP
jgi:preprotein translocase subunit SecG